MEGLPNPFLSHLAHTYSLWDKEGPGGPLGSKQMAAMLSSPGPALPTPSPPLLELVFLPQEQAQMPGGKGWREGCSGRSQRGWRWLHTWLWA